MSSKILCLLFWFHWYWYTTCKQIHVSHWVSLSFLSPIWFFLQYGSQWYLQQLCQILTIGRQTGFSPHTPHCKSVVFTIRASGECQSGWTFSPRYMMLIQYTFCSVQIMDPDVRLSDQSDLIHEQYRPVSMLQYMHVPREFPCILAFPFTLPWNIWNSILTSINQSIHLFIYLKHLNLLEHMFRHNPSLTTFTWTLLIWIETAKQLNQN